MEILRRHGIDIVSILTVGQGLQDHEIVRFANDQDRLFVTLDKDFGELIFGTRLHSKGVILIRLESFSPDRLATKLKALFDSEVELEGNFVVLEEEKIRITRIKS